MSLWPSGDVRSLMDVAELGSYLGLPVSTVHDWRVHGKGLAAYPFGKHLKFAVAGKTEMIEQAKPIAVSSKLHRS